MSAIWDPLCTGHLSSPVETHSLCRLAMSLSRLSFISSGPEQTTSDTVALVLFSQVISHFARQSHSKALPRRSLRRAHISHRRVTHSEEQNWYCTFDQRCNLRFDLPYNCLLVKHYYPESFHVACSFTMLTQWFGFHSSSVNSSSLRVISVRPYVALTCCLLVHWLYVAAVLRL